MPDLQPTFRGDWLGRSAQRVDILDKVTGRAIYATDVELPGMAHAYLVRSTVAHGIIRRIDITTAEQAPGVVCVLTGDELRHLEPYYGEWVLDQPPLAIDVVRYIGEPIVGVVARTYEEAVAAAECVEIDIDPLPVVATVEDALADGAAVVHQERASADDVLPNICYKAEFDIGDVDAAIAGAAHVHEATYYFPSTYQFPMEPFAYVAEWHNGRLEMISGTQQPFKVRNDLARIFDLPVSQVRVQVPYVGGGYGGKGQCKYEPVTAALAIKAGCPVRLAVSMEDAFRTIRRHSAQIRVITATAEDGTIIARDIRTLFDTGAYADKGPRVTKKGAYRAAGAYNIPNVRSVAYAVYTNTVPAGAFRGFSTPQVVWACESSIDEVAVELGRDPVEYRKQVLAQRGDPFLADDTPIDADLREGLSMAVAALGAGDGGPQETGRGAAVAVKDGGGGTGSSQAMVRVQPDGSVEVLVGTVEIGQGSMTVLAQIAADALGAHLNAVRVAFPDTDVVPFDRGTGASRSTVAVGSAVEAAARRARAELVAAARSVWELDDEDKVELVGRELAYGGQSRPLREVLATAQRVPHTEVVPIQCPGAHEAPATDHPLGASALFYEVAHGAAEVTVDRQTGVVSVRRYASVSDVGKALNPSSVEGQDEGGAVMGLGHTLQEELVFEDAELVSTNLVEYRVPRAEDLPDEFHTLLLENGDGPGPLGAKGAGEGGILPFAPAVANAIFDATGVRVRRLPITPEAMWRALQEEEGKDAPTTGRREDRYPQ